MAKKVKLSKWDAADDINTAEDAAMFLEAAAEDFELGHFLAALGAVARSKGMADISVKTGLSRESLYKALDEGGHPLFENVMKVLGALDLKITFAPQAKAA
jgi:probable addiction module antidote protein